MHRGKDPVALEENLLLNFKTNTVAQIHLFNIFTPLILRGAVKKVIAISTGHADIDLVTNHDLSNAPLYAISKVALNMAVAKFSAQYRSDGVLFMAICPGVVDTGLFNDCTLLSQFPHPPNQMAPHWTAKKI
jgi:NAD(P)-dependent dehydrogenase (short-subunit alcohol dehydrogenase family)